MFAGLNMFAGLKKFGQALTPAASPFVRMSGSAPAPTFASLAQAAPAPAPAPMFAQAAPAPEPAVKNPLPESRKILTAKRPIINPPAAVDEDAMGSKMPIKKPTETPSKLPSKKASKTLRRYMASKSESARASSAKRKDKRRLKIEKKLSKPIALKFFHQVRRNKDKYNNNIHKILEFLQKDSTFMVKVERYLKNIMGAVKGFKLEENIIPLIKLCVPENVLYSSNLKDKDFEELCNLILTNFESTEQNKGYIQIFESELQPFKVCIQSKELVVQETHLTPKARGKGKTSAAAAVAAAAAAVEERVTLNGCLSNNHALEILLRDQHAFVSANIYSKNPPPPPPPPPPPGDDAMPPGYIDNDDEFPSVVINGLVFSIGPIFDDESTFGRPLIYIRIHNHDPINFPNGIYFWSYLSFSEGGMARAYFAFNTELIIKGVDYTKPSFVEELSQVCVNKYYKKNCLDKKKNRTYLPHRIMNAFELLFFCNNMIHLQSKYVWDFLMGHYCEPTSINPASDPPTNPPPHFNRHCYAIYNHNAPPLRGPQDLIYNPPPFRPESTNTLRQYIKEGVFKNTLGFYYTNYRTGHTNYNRFEGNDIRKQEVFRRMSFLQSNSDLLNTDRTIPLVSCFTTVGFLRVNDFEVLLKDWREKSFWVQGGNDFTRREPSLGFSPVEFAIMGCGLKGEDLKYNDYLYSVFPDCITRSIRASRILSPLMTAHPGAQFEMFESVKRSGDLFNFDSSFISTTKIIKLLEKPRISVDNKFASLPVCIQATILKICELFNPGNHEFNSPELDMLRESFSGSFLEIPRPIDHTRIKEILVTQASHTGIKHIIQLVTALALYRDALVSDIFQTYMNKQTFVKTITAPLTPQQMGFVEAYYISESGTYIPIGSIGGPNTRSFPLYDPLNPVNTHPDTKPYVFLSVRDSRFLNYLIPGTGFQKIHSLADINNPANSIAVKVYTATCLYRVLFYVNKDMLMPNREFRDLLDNSPQTTGVEFVIACSSTVTIGEDGNVHFAANGNLTPIFSGPVTGSPAAGSPAGAMRRSVTIIGTYERYISAGCSLDAKKAEYSSSSGHPQYHSLLERFFDFCYECFTYFTTFPSFNSVFDKVLQYFHTGVGNDNIKAFFEDYWMQYFCDLPFIRGENGANDLPAVDNSNLRRQILEKLRQNTSRLEALTAILVGPTLEILRSKDAEHAQDLETEAVFTDAGDDDDDDDSSDRGSSTSISSSDNDSGPGSGLGLRQGLLGQDDDALSSSSGVEYKPSSSSSKSMDNDSSLSPGERASQNSSNGIESSKGGGSLRRIYTRKIKKHMKHNKRHNKRYTKKKKVRFIRGLIRRIIKNTTHKRKARRIIHRNIKHKKNNKTMRRMRRVRK